MSGIPVMHSDTQMLNVRLMPSVCSPHVTFGFLHIIWGIPAPKVNRAKEQLQYRVFSSYFQVFTFLGYFMVLIGSLFPTFWDNILVPNINNKLLTKHCATPQNAEDLNCTLAEV